MPCKLSELYSVSSNEDEVGRVPLLEEFNKLSARWMTSSLAPRLAGLNDLWRKRPLTLQPFLPADNHPPFQLAAAEAWLRRASRELRWLLRLRFPRFASHCLLDPDLRRFLDSFLRYRRPAALLSPSGDASRGGAPSGGGSSRGGGDPAGLPCDGFALLADLDRLVLLLHLRLVEGDQHRRIGLEEAPEEPNSETAARRDEEWGLALASTGALCLPGLLDLAALHGAANPDLTQRWEDFALPTPPSKEGWQGLKREA